MPSRPVAANTGIPFDDRVRWITARNLSGEIIPSHALCKVSGALDGSIYLDKPDQDGQDCVVNSSYPIPINEWGVVTRETPARILVNQEEGVTPESGETWGAKAGEWELYSNKRGYLIAGGYYGADQTVMAIRQGGECVIPVAIRIDGGDVATGFDFTVMQQTDADPSEFEEVDWLTSDELGFNAFEANGEFVSSGTTIYPGQIDFCRQKAFFFGGTDPGRVIVEFAESTPSMGELYLANLRTELVDSGGLVSWSTGATVYAFPINSGTTPTLETLYFAFRTEEEETVEGLPVYEVDRCCDSIVDQSSSGSGDNVLGGIPCGAWTTVSVTYQYGSGPTVAVDCVGPGLFASDIFEYDPTNYPGWMVRLYFECNEGLTGHPAVTTESGTQPAEFSTAIRGDNHDTTTGPFVWDGVTDWDEYGDVSGSGYGGTFTIVSAS